MTTAVVLAAGLGKRLGAGGLPKWLVPVGDTCAAEVQLSGLIRAGVARVVVVGGSPMDAIEDFVAPWRPDIEIVLIENPEAERRNNWYSLLLGLRSGSRGDCARLVVVNSDLFATEQWFEQGIAEACRSTSPAALVVDTVRPLTDEAMKVAVDDGATRVVGIGKVDVPRPTGEYVGLATWDAAAAQEVRGVLESFLGDDSCQDHWYEHAIERHVRVGGEYGIIESPTPAWVEIDDQRDLEAARSLRVARPARARRTPGRPASR